MHIHYTKFSKKFTQEYALEGFCHNPYFFVIMPYFMSILKIP